MIIANSVVVSFWGSFWLLPLLAMFAEVVVEEAWIRRRCTDPGEVGFALFIMNGVTWLAFMSAVESTHALTKLPYWCCNVVFEVVVVVVEAWLIRDMTRNRFFVRRYRGGSLTWRQALAVSIVGNGVSVMASLLLLAGLMLLAYRR